MGYVFVSGFNVPGSYSFKHVDKDGLPWRIFNLESILIYIVCNCWLSCLSFQVLQIIPSSALGEYVQFFLLEPVWYTHTLIIWTKSEGWYFSCYSYWGQFSPQNLRFISCPWCMCNLLYITTRHVDWLGQYRSWKSISFLQGHYQLLELRWLHLAILSTRGWIKQRRRRPRKVD